ncbi:hypothetical protein D3C85_653300 [compost metagenome]
MAVAPGQQSQQRSQREPEQRFQRARQQNDDVPIRGRPTAEPMQPVAGCRPLVKAPTGDGFTVAKGRFIENGIDIPVCGLAVQCLLLQTWRLWRIGRQCGLHGGAQDHAQRNGERQHGQAAQALAQVAQHQFDVPGLQGRAPVEIKAEAARHVDRPPKHQDQDIENIGQVL